MFCGKCGAENANDAKFCFACGAELLTEDNSGTGKKEKVKKEKSGKKIFGKLIAVVIILALIAGGIYVLPRIITPKTPLLYQKDDCIAMWTHGDPAEFGSKACKGDSALVTAYLSNDEKYVFYSNVVGDEREVYCKNLADKDDKGKKIASDVIYYDAYANHKIIYITEDKDLYTADIDGKDKLARDVVYFRMAGDDKHVVWTTGKYGDETLYVKDMYSKKDAEKIVSDVNNVAYMSDDLKTIYYVDTDNVLYSMTNCKKAEQIAEDVGEIYVLKNGDDVQLIYADAPDIEDDSLDMDNSSDGNGSSLKSLFNSFTSGNGAAAATVDEASSAAVEVAPGITDEYYDEYGYSDALVPEVSMYIDDDLADKDAQMDYPQMEDYERTEVVDSFWGNWERTVVDDQYYDALDEYDAMLQRDSIRREFAKTCDPLERTYHIYDAKKNETADFASGVFKNIASSGNVFLYQTIDTDKIEKIKMSELEEMTYGERWSKFEEVQKTGVQTYKYDFDKTTPMEIPAEYNVESLIIDHADEDCNMIYFDIIDNDNKVLLKTKRTGQADVEVLTEEFAGQAEVVGDDVYYTAEETENYTATLYKNDEEISDDVVMYSIYPLPDEKAILFKEDASEKHPGDLIYCNGKTEKICDDCNGAMILEDGGFAYVADYSNKKRMGDLYIYKNGKSKKIDEDVRRLIVLEK